MVRRSRVEWRALYQLMMSASWEQRTTRLCRRSGECSSRLFVSVEDGDVDDFVFTVYFRHKQTTTKSKAKYLADTHLARHFSHRFDRFGHECKNRKKKDTVEAQDN